MHRITKTNGNRIRLHQTHALVGTADGPSVIRCDVAMVVHGAFSNPSTLCDQTVSTSQGSSVGTLRRFERNIKINVYCVELSYLFSRPGPVKHINYGLRPVFKIFKRPQHLETNNLNLQKFNMYNEALRATRRDFITFYNRLSYSFVSTRV